MKGRGASSNPDNRFENYSEFVDEDAWNDNEDSHSSNRIQTEYREDHSGSIITYNDSPDIPFKASINPYRGCEHGCAYCYARPTHEYLGLKPGLDFESKIFFKKNAPELLERELASRRWTPQTISMSGVTDAYQPIERSLKITRRCLEVLARYKNPVAIVTKNDLLKRDIDILQNMATWNGAIVLVSITTNQEELRRTLEPRTSSIRKRLELIRTLSDNKIPVGFLMAPVIPGLTDNQIPDIIRLAALHGAQFGGYIMLRLPYSVKETFSDWLEIHHPLKKEKILNQIRSIRGGSLNVSEYKERFRGKGVLAENINQLFKVICKKHSIAAQSPDLNCSSFVRPGGSQLELFD